MDPEIQLRARPLTSPEECPASQLVISTTNSGLTIRCDRCKGTLVMTGSPRYDVTALARVMRQAHARCRAPAPVRPVVTTPIACDCVEVHEPHCPGGG